jgi:hypothetical protein
LGIAFFASGEGNLRQPFQITQQSSGIIGCWQLKKRRKHNKKVTKKEFQDYYSR